MRTVRAHSGFLEELLSSSLSVVEASLRQHTLVDKCGGHKQDGLVQKQTDLSMFASGIVNDLQEVGKLDEGHIGMDIFQVCFHQGALLCSRRER